LFWFRRAVRLDDNRALSAAVDAAPLAAPVFILDDTLLTHPSTGPARTRFLFGSLSEQEAAGCVLGRDYPLPIVDHAEQKKRALGLYRRQEDAV
jgi:deoxyribodipyrimidine photolyase